VQSHIQSHTQMSRGDLFNGEMHASSSCPGHDLMSYLRVDLSDLNIKESSQTTPTTKINASVTDGGQTASLPSSLRPARDITRDFTAASSGSSDTA